MLAVNSTALAGGKSSSSAPAHASAPRGGGGGGGVFGGGGGGFGGRGGGAPAAPHLPGSMGAAAHIPGGAAGAHIPGGAAGAHIPGSAAAHIPGGAGAHVPGAPTAHVPGGTTAASAHAPATAGVHSGAEATPHNAPAPGHFSEAHPSEANFPSHAPAGHVGGPAGRDGEAAARRPGTVLHETRDLHPPRGRDIAHERATLAAHAHDFHDRDVHHFNEREFRRWHDGRWNQDWRYGRYGWWYEVDDVDYPYDAPIYPYPLEVSEPVVVETEVQPVAVVVDGGTPGSVMPGYAGGGPPPPGEIAYADQAGAGGAPRYVIVPLPAAPNVTYRCPSPEANYPVVHICTSTWAAVPIAP
jgi:hypothetical protein